jgi:hypothetical protein
MLDLSAPVAASSRRSGFRVNVLRGSAHRLRLACAPMRRINGRPVEAPAPLVKFLGRRCPNVEAG